MPQPQQQRLVCLLVVFNQMPFTVALYVSVCHLLLQRSLQESSEGSLLELIIVSDILEKLEHPNDLMLVHVQESATKSHINL
jgi:hypothetical protein